MSTINTKILLIAENKRKYIYFYAISCVGVFFLILLGLLAFFQGNFFLGSLDILIASALIGIIIYSFKSGNITLATDIGVSGIAIFFMYLFATGGVNKSACLWYYTFPLISFFLLGAKKGAWASFILLLF